MVLDTSALIAIHTEAPGFRELFQKVDEAKTVLIGAPTVFETALVISSRSKADARLALSHGLRQMRATIVPFTEEHYEAATTAFMRFGKGRHPAGLNFGDCMSYAVAVVSGLPLLYTGTDFSLTDVRSA